MNLLMHFEVRTATTAYCKKLQKMTMGKRSTNLELTISLIMATFTRNPRLT